MSVVRQLLANNQTYAASGLLSFTDEEFARARELSTGLRPPWSAGAFDHLDESVRRSVGLVLESPFVPRKNSVRGYIYEVETGWVWEVGRTG